MLEGWLQVGCCCARVVVAQVVFLSAVHAEPGRWKALGPFGGPVSHISYYEAEPDTVFALGDFGLFRSNDGGVQWFRIGTGLPPDFFPETLTVETQAPVLFMSSRQTLCQSSNGGFTWQPILTLPVPNESIVAISLRRNSATDIAMGTDRGVYVSHDAGMTWAGPTPADLDRYALLDVLYTQDGTLYVGKLSTALDGINGARVIKSVDGGVTWIPSGIGPGMMSPDTTQGLPAVGISSIVAAPTNAGHLFAIDDTSIFFSLDAGVNWGVVSRPQANGTCTDIRSISPDPSSDVGLFVACESGLHHAPDASAVSPAWTSWSASNGLGTADTLVTAPTPHPDYPSTPVVLAGTLSDGLFRSVDGGTSWAPGDEGFGTIGILALAPHPYEAGSTADILAGSITDTPLLKSEDDGVSWLPATNGPEAVLIRSLTIDPTTADANPAANEPYTAYAAGRALAFGENANGGIYKSVDGGVNWTTIDQGIAIVNGHPDMGIVRAIVPDPTSCGSPPCAAGSSPLQTVYVGGSGRAGAAGLPYLSSRIYKSVDAGATWSPAEGGLPPSQNVGPAGMEESVASYVAAIAIDPSTPSTLYASTAITWSYYSELGLQPMLENGVFKSTDGGASWVHSSNGLPRCGGPGSSHCDVLTLAIDPADPQSLLAGLVDYSINPARPRIYRSDDAGTSWVESGPDIAGTGVRSLLFEADGSAVYAGIEGDGLGANPGGVYRSADGGYFWNSMSLGLNVNTVYGLSLPPRSPGTPVRLLLGSDAGAWAFSAADDEDSDGVPTQVENDYFGGDGNGDAIADATQPYVATLARPPTLASLRTASPSNVRTISMPTNVGDCTRLNDVTTLEPDRLPDDPGAAVGAYSTSGLVRFSLPGCGGTYVHVTFHGANFGPGWVWRNYGPTVPGDNTTFAWYTFAGAQLINPETWELLIDSGMQGNYRNDPVNILFVGGPVDDRIFVGGFEP